MKLEEGKFYKCRDGSKAQVYAIDMAGDRPVYGRVLGHRHWIDCYWNSDGTHPTKEADLVQEWVEPLVVEFEDMAISNGWALRDNDDVFICNNALNAFAGKRVKVRVEEIL